MSSPYFYNDGRRADRRPVRIELSAEGLRLVDETGIVVAFWTYEGLDLAEAAGRREPYRLMHSGFGQASITSEDKLLLKTLSQVCPRIEERTASPFRRFIFRLSMLALAAACAVWFLTIAVGFLAGPLAQIVPATWERQLGTQIAKRMTEETGICSSTPGIRALDKLTGRIAAVVSAPFPIRIQVTDDRRVNSFAVSGGAMVVFRGMIDEAKNPEEFAGLLAHEVAHTALRHPVEGMIRTLGIPFIISAYSEGLSELAFSSAAFKEKLLALSYSAGNEADADATSIEILRAASIATTGVVDLFTRLRTQGGGPDSFITHHAQAGMTIGRASGSPGTGAALAPADWAALQNICSEKQTLR